MRAPRAVRVVEELGVARARVKSAGERLGGEDRAIWLERHDEALDAALRIHADVLAAHGENHPLARIADSYRAAALNRLGRPEEAAPLLDGAHAALAAAIGGDHPQTLLVEAWQAEAMALSGRHDEAVALMESVLERARAALVPGHYRLRDLDRIAMRIQAAASG